MFTFFDTTSEQQGSMFTLTLDGAGRHWSATLDVITADSPDWFINYITLHLDGGQRPMVDNFVGPTGNWNAIGSGEAEVSVLKRGGDFPQNSWIGLYTTEIENAVKNDPAIGDIDKGVELDTVPASWTFDVWLADGTILNLSPSIQVGYYNFDPDSGRDGKIFFTQMSQEPDVVPEPATLLLVGSGLLGGAFFRKRLKQ